MDKKKFDALLVLIIPEIIKYIKEKYNYDDVQATVELYESKVYHFLEDEETKLWHFSPRTLFEMFDEEKNTGEVVFPEEM